MPQGLLNLLSLTPLARPACSSATPFPAQAKQEATEEAPQNGKAELPADFDTSADRHRGQLALRKLYHESERLLVVLYTSPTCGPCRSLKPIFSKVVDDYPGKVRSRLCLPGEHSCSCPELVHTQCARCNILQLSPGRWPAKIVYQAACWSLRAGHSRGCHSCVAEVLNVTRSGLCAGAFGRDRHRGGPRDSRGSRHQWNANSAALQEQGAAAPPAGRQAEKGV